MPLSFYFGISGLVLIVALWVAGVLVLRARRRKNGLVPLDAPDDAAARQELAGGRNAAALAMAVRGSANRQVR